MPSQKAKKTFSMGAAALLTIACSLGLIAHAFLVMANRGGGLLLLVSLLISCGYLYVDYIHGWCSWWATEEKEDKPVIYTAFAGMALVSLVMVFSGGAVMIHYVLKKEAIAEQAQQLATAKSAADVEAGKDRAKKEADAAADAQFALQLEQLKQGGATQRTINGFIAAHDKKQQRSLLTQAQAAQPPQSPTLTSMESPGDVGAQFVSILDSFARFWVFFIPTLTALLAYLAVTFSQLAPGGASVGVTSDGRRSQSVDEFPEELPEAQRRPNA